MSLLLLSEHDLETIEISQILTDFITNELLSGTSSSEFSINISSSPALHHGLGTGSTRNINDDTGQVSVTDEERHTGNRGTLDEDTVKINDVKDDSGFTSEFAFLQQDNTTDFNKGFESLNYLKCRGCM